MARFARRWYSPPPYGWSKDAEGELHSKVHRVQNVVVIRKRSVLELARSGVLGSVLQTTKLLSSDAVLAAHNENMASFNQVRAHVINEVPHVRCVDNMSREDVLWADLVVSVGGDGTFLTATHSIADGDFTPILGVNSSPSSSMGFFCAATADTFPRFLSDLTRDPNEWRNTRPLWRMRVLLNGRMLPHPLLNDVLFASSSPASTMRYSLTVDGHTQYQKSSGIWVSTSAGSTGAILSAGGSEQHFWEQRLQFRVRELWPMSLNKGDQPLVGGMFENIELVSLMPQSSLYMDGTFDIEEVRFGDHITFQPSNNALNWVCSDTVCHLFAPPFFFFFFVLFL